MVVYDEPPNEVVVWTYPADLEYTMTVPELFPDAEMVEVEPDAVESMKEVVVYVCIGSNTSIVPDTESEG